MLRWILALILVLLDQVFKALALLYAKPGGLFVLTKNTGITFGFFQGANFAMIIISVIATAFVVYYLHSAKNWDALGLTLILAGIIGNFIDRLVRGAVIDYVSISSFPVFNFADSCIVVGILLILVNEFRKLKLVKFVKLI